MSQNLPQKGPWVHRLLVHIFTITLGFLIYWLLGFVLDDIGSWPGPDYAEIEKRLVQPQLLNQEQQLAEQLTETRRLIQDQQQRQTILRDSTSNSQTTMNQLLEFQRLRLQKGDELTGEEKQALANSQTLFLADQQRYQQLNEEISRLNEQLRDTERQMRENDAKLQRAREPVEREYRAEFERHELAIAAAKLSVLTPLLIVAVVLFLKKRDSVYAPLVTAFGIAAAVKVMLVMHEYFPARYFKYVLILTCLAIVARTLVYLVNVVAHPKRGWLLKQYREAYETHFCPICSYPIRRGPLKYAYWTRRSLKRLPALATGALTLDEAYTCPSCSTRLYEECPACHGIRHSLLPTCEHCGSGKTEA